MAGNLAKTERCIKPWPTSTQRDLATPINGPTAWSILSRVRPRIRCLKRTRPPRSLGGRAGRHALEQRDSSAQHKRHLIDPMVNQGWLKQIDHEEPDQASYDQNGQEH